MNEPKDASSTDPEGKERSNQAIVEIGAFSNANQVRMSFNPSTPDGAVKLVKATLSEIPTLESMSNKELLLTDWIRHPAQSIDQQTGEVKDFTRIVVFDDKGQGYSCGSMGVDKALTILEMTAGKAPWKPPLKVTVIIRRLSNKNNWMILDPDIAALEARFKPSK